MEKGIIAAIATGLLGLWLYLSFSQQHDADRATFQAKQSLHLQHRYASTTYKDQGNQAAKGIYVIDTMRPGGVGTRDAYVGMTRAESGTIVLTNDVKRARDLVRQEQGATKAITDALGLSKSDKKADQELSRKTERTPSFMGERETKTDQKSEKSADRQPSKSDERQAVRGMSMHR